MGTALQQLRNGVLLSAETGIATIYSLKTVEERGTAYIGPGTKVYEGMIIGLNRRSEDMEINVTKEKKLTNVRASSTDMTTQLTPFTDLTLEEALDFMENDGLTRGPAKLLCGRATSPRMSVVSTVISNTIDITSCLC